MPSCTELLALHWPGGGVVLRCDKVARHEGAHAALLYPKGETFSVRMTWRTAPGR